MEDSKLTDEEIRRLACEVVKKMTTEREDGQDFASVVAAQVATQVASKIRGQVMDELYNNLGQGVWRLFWQGLTGAIVALAAIGAAKGGLINKLFGGE